MKIVTPENFDACVVALDASRFLSCDTETTGLYPWKNDRLFSIQFSDAGEDYYFNFNNYGGSEPLLQFSDIMRLEPLFRDRTIFIQNAKFDMAFLYNEGLRFYSTDIHDTEVAARLIRNDHLSYSLDNQAQRELGEAKDDAVMEYLKKNKCFTSIRVPGKDSVYKAFHFDQVPFEIITKYGCKDTRLTYDLGMKQLAQLQKLRDEAKPGQKSVWDVYELEKSLTHTCFEIERVGVKINKEYCNEAVEFETQRIQKAEKDFTAITGVELTDSGKCLGPIFQGLGFSPGKTEGGEAEITDSFLSGISHPLGEVIRECRDARKRANTYFKSYLYFSDEHGAIHANMKQSGTATGRFSYMDPNLQNIPSEDDSKYPVRRAFVPREDYLFLSVDYRQMEFRMMLDEAGQHDLIAKIIAGHDPHDATAELTGLDRKSAKTLNFGLLYGMGIVKLAFAILKMSPEEKSALKKYDDLEDKRMALVLLGSEVMSLVDPIIVKMKAFKAQYFAALPMVENFIIQCSGAVKERSLQSPGNGWIKTWLGRRAYFNDAKWAYKAANAKIQGGSADCVKLAMNSLHRFLENKKTRMILQIHDEIVFELHKTERDLVPEILKIMETAYPHRYIPMSCSCEISNKSLGDLVELTSL